MATVDNRMGRNSTITLSEITEGNFESEWVVRDLWIFMENHQLIEINETDENRYAVTEKGRDLYRILNAMRKQAVQHDIETVVRALFS